MNVELATVLAMLDHRIRGTMAAEANALELAETPITSPPTMELVAEAERLAEHCRIALAEQTAIYAAVAELAQ